MNITKTVLYETDFSQWIDETIKVIEDGRFSELDLPNLIEELQSLGISDKRALRGHLRVLMMHLLKWQFQPSKRTPSWRSSIHNARNEIEDILKDSPSLKNYIVESIDWCYARAVKLAIEETGLSLSDFPNACPYKDEQILDDEFWP